MLKLFLPGLILLAGTGWAVCRQEPGRPGGAEPAGPDAQVRELLKAYADTFNKGDAAALAEYWAKDSVSIDTESGDRLVGREAIRTALTARFKEPNRGRLNIQLRSFRFLKPDVLSLEGTTIVTTPGEEEADESTFTALLTNQGGKWQIEQAQQSPVGKPSSAPEALRRLDWLVGAWVDDSPGVRVETNITWSEQKTFLLRKYTVHFEADEDPVSGTQVIGWDPRTGAIRSWTFASDGSFGEGEWSGKGSEWRVKVTHVLADGKVMSGTQVITRVDGKSAKVQMLGQEVDGELSPATPAVTMVRQETQPETKPAGSGGQP
jgi:uncharacterized protein (TIGR02246 family)